MIIIFYILSFFAEAKDFSEVKKEIIKEKQIKKQIEIIAENQELFLKTNDLMESEVFLLDVMRVIPEDETISNDLKFEFYHLLANIYRDKKEYELALEFNFKAFKFAESSESPRNLAKSYLLFGDLYFLMEDYEEAVEYDLLGIKFCEERKEEDLKAKFYLMLGKVYYAIEKFDDAEEYLLNALNMTLGKPDFDVVAEIKLYLGKVYLGMKEIEDQKEELELLNNELVKRNVEIEQINLNLMGQELELRESNATKDKFLSIIAHDLKNPIAGIIMTTDLLLQYIDKFDKEKLTDKINEINRSSLKLRDLLDTLLEWARATTGQIPFNPEAINIDESIEGIHQLLNSNFQNKNIDFIIESPACCRVVADNKMLDTIIRNIISNAIKFTPEGGKIYIASEDHGDKLKLKIRDTGVGIPEDKIPQLFSISSNYTTLGTQKEKGTGLGLVLCKEFIDINKGSIEVNSELGKGTTFTITLNKFVA